MLALYNSIVGHIIVVAGGVTGLKHGYGVFKKVGGKSNQQMYLSCIVGNVGLCVFFFSSAHNKPKHHEVSISAAWIWFVKTRK